MTPFKVTASAHNTKPSASVTLERGAYRLRAPRSSHALRPPPHLDIHYRNAEQTHRRMHIALLVFLLMLACLFCFGAAWRLYSTRWDARYVDSVPPFTDQPQVPVFPFGHDNVSISGLDVNEKYMTYLPHSGFHNQRIALENAIVLSTLLNRTLIMPPIRLGKKPIRYVKYESLTTFFALAGKEGLYHCTAIPVHAALPAECFDYFDYTHLSWDWLVNITQYTGSPPRILELDPSTVWSRFWLEFNDTNSMMLRDGSPYHYRFYDTPFNVSVAGPGKYKEQIDIFGIASSSKRFRFLHIGTLFGSSRLALTDPQNLAMRTAIRRNMIFSNPILESVAYDIREAIGFHYFGAHIRFSDGQFEKNSASNVHDIWWKLIRTCYGYSHSDSLDLERIFWPPARAFANATRVGYADFSVVRPPSSCRQPAHDHPQLASLNRPLYISTDVENPREEPSLSVFLRTFPCVLFISDFQAALEPLNEIKNDDGLRLARFVLPFLDAMIVGHASAIITTEGSTFSRYVEDVLWRVYHGGDIVQRG